MVHFIIVMLTAFGVVVSVVVIVTVRPAIIATYVAESTPPVTVLCVLVILVVFEIG